MLDGCRSKTKKYEKGGGGDENIFLLLDTFFYSYIFCGIPLPLGFSHPKSKAVRICLVLTKKSGQIRGGGECCLYKKRVLLNRSITGSLEIPILRIT